MRGRVDSTHTSIYAKITSSNVDAGVSNPRRSFCHVRVGENFAVRYCQSSRIKSACGKQRHKGCVEDLHIDVVF